MEFSPLSSELYRQQEIPPGFSFPDFSNGDLDNVYGDLEKTHQEIKPLIDHHIAAIEVIRSACFYGTKQLGHQNTPKNKQLWSAVLSLANPLMKDITLVEELNTNMLDTLQKANYAFLSRIKGYETTLREDIDRETAKLVQTRLEVIKTGQAALNTLIPIYQANSRTFSSRKHRAESFINDLENACQTTKGSGSFWSFMRPKDPSEANSSEGSSSPISLPERACSAFSFTELDLSAYIEKGAPPIPDLESKETNEKAEGTSLIETFQSLQKWHEEHFQETETAVILTDLIRGSALHGDELLKQASYLAPETMNLYQEEIKPTAEELQKALDIVDRTHKSSEAMLRLLEDTNKLFIKQIQQLEKIQKEVTEGETKKTAEKNLPIARENQQYLADLIPLYRTVVEVLGKRHYDATPAVSSFTAKSQINPKGHSSAHSTLLRELITGTPSPRDRFESPTCYTSSSRSTTPQSPSSPSSTRMHDSPPPPPNPAGSPRVSLESPTTSSGGRHFQEVGGGENTPKTEKPPSTSSQKLRKHSKKQKDAREVIAKKTNTEKSNS